MADEDDDKFVKLLWQLVVRATYAKPISRTIARLSTTAIPIFGVGGTGKSTIGKFFEDPKSLPDDIDYKKSIVPETVFYEDGFWQRFIVMPGQDYFTQGHWAEYLQYIADGKIGMALNLVAFGYHSIDGPSITETPEYKAWNRANGTSEIEMGDFVQLFTASRRAKEVAGIQNIADQYCSVDPSAINSPLSLITIINKHDLWMDDYEFVSDFYQDGDTYNSHYSGEEELGGLYSTQIARIEQHLGGKFVHRIVPCCLVRKNLETEKETLVTKNPAYTSARHKRDIRNLAEQIKQYQSDVKW